MDKVGEFILKKKLGEGGMGVVFLAHQESLDREVALKFLTPQIFGGDVNKQRFFREARASARLVHPNIIQIYSIGDYEGNPYYTMEYIDGQDLAKLLKQGPAFTFDETLEIVRSVAKALDTAAHHEIVHRDIKPANIMLTRSGVLKVMDFGLAKPKETDSKLTMEGQIVGTPTYISPEQALSKPVDIRSDLYSLGCIFYECLAGHPPFQAVEIAQVIYKHVYDAPPPVVSPLGPVPAQLQQICLKLLAKDPAARYQKPTDLLKDLSQAVCNSAAAEVSLAERVRLSKERSSAPLPPPASRNPAQDVLDEILPALGEVRAPVSMSAPTVARPAPRPSELEIVLPPAPVVPPPPKPKPALPPRPSGQVQSLTETPAIPSRHVSSMLPRPGSTKVLPNPATAAASRSSPVGLPAIQAMPPVGTPRPLSNRDMLQTIIEEPPPSARLPAQAQTPAIPPRVVSEPQRRPSNSNMQATIVEDTAASIGAHREVERMKSTRQTYFVKNAQNLWGYDVSKGHCEYSEGLAAEPLPGKDTMVGNLGDCPLCTNWTRDLGCVLAVVEQLARTSNRRGISLLEEQSEAYCSAKLFTKAIALLERHIKANVDEPAGYRALARVYDHPDYDGPDRARATILFKRFIELSRQEGDTTSMGVRMVQDRLQELQAVAANGRKRASRIATIPNTATQQSFRCFYRSQHDLFFSYCVLTPEHLWITRVGEVDPVTGTPAAELSNPSKRGSTFFKRLVGKESVDEQRVKAARELERLQQTAIADLKKESTHCIFLDLPEVRAIFFTEDPAVETPLLKILIGETWHELIFGKAARIESERAALLLRRVTGR
ncbi:MAG: protein kinase [Planctomycetes bacterium]|nr:protein kinase [Planctomycetota bacterium]